MLQIYQENLSLEKDVLEFISKQQVADIFGEYHKRYDFIKANYKNKTDDLYYMDNFSMFL